MLETVIAENTAAIRELIAAIKAGAPLLATKAESVAKEVKKAIEKTPRSEPAPVATEEPAPAPDDVRAEVQMTAAEAEKALDGIATRPAAAATYQDAATAVTALAKTKGRDAAVAILAQFGAGKLPEVKPEDFAAVVAACEEALA